MTNNGQLSLIELWTLVQEQRTEIDALKQRLSSAFTVDSARNGNAPKSVSRAELLKAAVLGERRR